MSTEIPEEWYFITAPQQVSWSKDSRTNIVETYGTNNPYVHYGTTKLRSLSLNDSMVEGFSDGKVVEQNIIDLEACMRMVLESDDGYAAPYCWRVYAGGKSYGTYLITGVNVNEEIRDNGGLAARAKVDISLQEVSPYQVSSGIDISADALSGTLNEETIKYNEDQAKKNEQAKQDEAAKDKNKTDGKDKDKNKGSGGSSSSSGSGSGSGSGDSGGGGKDYGDGGYKGPTNIADKLQ